MEQRSLALETRGISKRYGGIEALKGVDLTLYEGEVCALLGENGAGKSTFIKILTGAEQRDAGEILLYGVPTAITDPVSARHKGITAIYQELSLIEQLTVAENIYLGHELVSGGALGWVRRRSLMSRARDYLQRFGIDIDPRKRVRDLGMGEKRIIEIVKALSVNARILFLDEPTTGMSWAEIARLFAIMKDLKQHRVTMIYISHHLEEVFQVCDRVTVLRDGQNVGTFEIAQVDVPTLIQAIIGKEMSQIDERGPSTRRNEVLLEASGFQAKAMRAPVTFRLHAGEILGVTGIIGAGKSELGRGLFGAARQLGGTLMIKGETVRLQSPADARRLGIAFIPEDRKSQGLFLSQSVEHNLTVANIDMVTRAGLFVRGGQRRRLAKDIAGKIRIVPPDVQMRARNLSGGNQQKVVIGKWLLGQPQILIMDEPTRGVDVGAKEEIYNLIRSLAASGCGVLLLSSEFDEVRRLCDRVLVLRDGAVISELDAEAVTNDVLLRTALGG